MNRMLLFLGLGMILASSCVRYKDLVNFSEGPALPSGSVPSFSIPELIIQEDDLLSIRISAFDPEAAAPFNIDPAMQGGNMNMQGNISRPLIGYLVDKDGYISLPKLGPLKAAGQTTVQLKEEISEKLKAYLVDPVVQVRFINFQVSVLGEVNNPGNFILPNERITLLDALSNAGDLTPYANRTNILVIRNYNGQRQYGRINLKDRAIFESPFYYLRQNDIVYVEPMPVRTADTRDQAQRILPYLSIVTSLTTLTLTIINISQ